MRNKYGLTQKGCVYFSLIFVGGITMLIDSIVVYFVYSVILLGLIYYSARYSFFTAISFILVFSLLQTLVQAATGNAHGMINNARIKVPLYEGIHGLCTISFLLTLLFFILFTNLVENEKAVLQTEIVMTNFTAFFLIAAAVVIVIMMFPSIPDFKLHLAIRRSQGLMRNYGWVLTALILAGLTIDTSWRKKWIWGGYAFIVLWIFGHAERAECLGFVIYIVLKTLNKKDFSEVNNLVNQNKESTVSVGKRIVVFGGLFGLFALLIAIGLYREGSRVNNTDFTFVNIIHKLLVQATAGDVIYVFDCATDMWKKGHLVYGITYIDWLLNLIPGGSSKYQAAHYIKRWYFTMGGALFFTEPMMNFGMIGVLISNVLFCLAYFWVTKKSTILRAMIFMPMVIEIFRTAWYGRNGWELAVFVEIPIIYIGMKYVTNHFMITIK